MLSDIVNVFVNLVLSKWILGVGILCYFVYRWSTATYITFDERNVKFIPPFPFFGNYKDIIFHKKSYREWLMELYNSFPEEKFCGYFEMRTPSFLIRDPELIKNLVVKDCETFLDHRLDSKHCSDLLFSRSLVKLSGTEWKDMRSTLSPAFTGSKLRTMFMFMTECCNSSVQYLEESANGKPMLMDLTDMFCRFTADIFGTCIFGIRVESFRNPNNDFYLNGKKSVDFSGLRGLRTFFMGNFPKFTNFFGITSCEKNNANYFRSLIWDTIHHRERENIVRSDMIQLLMQARRGKLHYENKEEDEIGYAAVKETNLGKTISQSKLQEDDLTAQCLFFFMAGFNTSATSLCFMAYELALNPDIQNTLLAEIDATQELLNGQPLTYEALQSMTYLDMVVSESLRLWPTGIMFNRIANKPYNLEVDGKSYKINVGERILIPVLPLHRDPKYFPDPLRFDPERFSKDNIKNIKPYTYLPFAVGPRNCIGSRFALMEVKSIMYHILTKFTFEVSEKTQIPPKYTKHAIQIGSSTKIEGGLWLNLVPRSK